MSEIRLARYYSNESVRAKHVAPVTLAEKAKSAAQYGAVVTLSALAFLPHRAEVVGAAALVGTILGWVHTNPKRAFNTQTHEEVTML